jgi:hypothetical protein
MRDERGFEAALEGAEEGAVAELFAAVRTLARDPQEGTAARHVTMITAELAGASTPTERSLSRVVSFSARFAAGGVAGFMSLTGLAYAGVDLPGTAAETAIESVLGVELPNQAEEHQNPPSDPGRASSAPSSGSEDKGRSSDAPRADGDNRGRGEAKGKDVDRPRGRDGTPGNDRGKGRGRSGVAPAENSKKDGNGGRSSEAPGVTGETPDRSDQTPRGNAKGKQGSG